jgi:putative ABC transport system permease protein
MACCVLILLYIQSELSYDGYHKNASQIYRVIRETRTNAGVPSYSPGTDGLLAAALRKDYPEVQQTVRMMTGRNVWVRYGDKGFGQTFCLADESVLEVFTFPLIKGETVT